MRYLIIAVMITVALAACKKEDDEVKTVSMTNNTFSPASITVAKGTTVKWTNNDNVNHDVTSTTAVFTSGVIGANGTYSYTFNTTGTFPYTCTLHPGMDGTVIVQ